MSPSVPGWLFAESYVAQIFGFLFVAYAWFRSLQELRHGRGVPRTRRLLFLITSVALLACLFPALFALCYFAEGCFRPLFRDYLRVFSGNIILLYGLFKAMLYITKEVKLD